MNIECNECRQRLSDALDETANPAAQSALAEHLAGCDACRAELKLMQAARAELRAFPTVAAPADLRSRVRAQLESTPVAAQQMTAPAAETPIITAPANIKSTPGVQPRKSQPQRQLPTHRTWRDYLRLLLNNSTTITWASCCALLLVYFASISRQPQPTPPYEVAERTPVSASRQQDAEDISGNKKKAPTAPPAGAPAVKSLPNTAASDTLPASDVPPSTHPVPAAPAPEPAAKSPNASLPSTHSERAPETSDRKPETPAPSAKPAPPAPKLKSAPATPKSDSSTSSTFFANGNSSDSDNVSGNEAPQAPVRSRSNDESPSAPAPAMQKRQNNYRARSTPDGARDSAPKSAGIASAERAQEHNETSKAVTRQITTHITTPRNLGWAQVSVVLAGDAYFEGGQKVRVIWSGSAQVGEPIELDFSVLSATGGTAKVILQEVKKGQAQTVAYKVVSLDTAR